jgi:hypothetical protein
MLSMAMVRARVAQPATSWGTLMLCRWLLSGFIALAMTAATVASAPAQPFTEVGAASAIRHASALSGRIRSYHRGPGSWTGLTPLGDLDAPQEARW